MTSTLLSLLLAALPAAADQAAAVDGSFTLETPAGWKAQAPKPGYLVSISPPGGKGGLTLAPAPANVKDENSALAGLKALAAQIGPRFKTNFGSISSLETTQPGRLVFVVGSLSGKKYLVGYFTVDERYYRVDVLADDAAGAANFALSSMRPGAASSAAGGMKQKGRIYPSDGSYSIVGQKGWASQPTSEAGVVAIKTKEADEIKIAPEPAVTDVSQADARVATLAAGAATTMKAKFSDPRTMEIEDHPFHFAAGHGDGEMIDTVLVGVFKSGASFFRISIVGKGNRPLDLATAVLERFALKGEESAAPPEVSKDQEPAVPAGPSESDKVAAKIKDPKRSAGIGEGYAWKLMVGMALVPILLVAGISYFGKARKEPQQP